jgi:hypothetical protein
MMENGAEGLLSPSQADFDASMQRNRSLSSSLTPISSAAPSESSESATDAIERVDFWVSPPPALDASEKGLYKPANEVDIPADHDEEDESPMKIINEIRLGTDLYFWVKSNNDVIYRVSILQNHQFPICLHFLRVASRKGNC